MDPLDRQHVDGVGDGLSIAIGILDRAQSLAEAREAVRTTLVTARQAKDRANLLRLRELASGLA